MLVWFGWVGLVMEKKARIKSGKDSCLLGDRRTSVLIPKIGSVPDPLSENRLIS